MVVVALTSTWPRSPIWMRCPSPTPSRPSGTNRIHHVMEKNPRSSTGGRRASSWPTSWNIVRLSTRFAFHRIALSLSRVIFFSFLFFLFFFFFTHNNNNNNKPGSDDGTVKVWDCLRLEKNVSNRSRLTYNQAAGKILALTFLQNTYAFASATDNGSVHICK